MVKYAFFFILCLFSFLGSYLYFYLGGYKSVSLEVIHAPALHMAAMDHRGEYHKILKTIEKVEAWSKENNISCKQTFGHYLDAPDSGPADRLRSYGGCIVEQEFTPNNKDILFKTLAPAKYIQARFTGAPSIGPMKVYPKVKSYAQENRIRIAQDALEIYTLYGQDKVLTEYYFRIIE